MSDEVKFSSSSGPPSAFLYWTNVKNRAERQFSHSVAFIYYLILTIANELVLKSKKLCDEGYFNLNPVLSSEMQNFDYFPFLLTIAEINRLII